MKKKLNLDNLEVKSFVTTTYQSRVKGGGTRSDHNVCLTDLRDLASMDVNCSGNCTNGCTPNCSLPPECPVETPVCSIAC